MVIRFIVFSCSEGVAVASHPLQPGFLIRRFFGVLKFVPIGSSAGLREKTLDVFLFS